MEKRRRQLGLREFLSFDASSFCTARIFALLQLLGLGMMPSKKRCASFSAGVFLHALNTRFTDLPLTKDCHSYNYP